MKECFTPKLNRREKKVRSKLISIRQQQGYTQYTMAAALGISRTHYSQIETGVKNPALELAMRIKQVLRHKDDDIFFNESSPKTGRRGRPPLITTKSRK